MSCNGCRVLKQRCDEPCALKQSLQWIHHQSQGHATLFIAKHYGRRALMSRISAMSDSRRPSVGRTINPVGGAVELLWTGNWHICQSAVEVVLQGSGPEQLTRADDGILPGSQGDSSESGKECGSLHPLYQSSRLALLRTVQNHLEGDIYCAERGLDLNTVTTMAERIAATSSPGGRYNGIQMPRPRESSEKPEEK